MPDLFEKSNASCPYAKGCGGMRQDGGGLSWAGSIPAPSTEEEDVGWHYVYDYTLYPHGGRRKEVLFKGWFRSADECIEAALKDGAIQEGDLFEVAYKKQVRRAGP